MTWLNYRNEVMEPEDATPEEMVGEVLRLILEDSDGRGREPSSNTKANLLHLIRAVVKEELESVKEELESLTQR